MEACPLNGPPAKDMKQLKYPFNNSLRQLKKKIQKIQRHQFKQFHWLFLFFLTPFDCQFSEENLAKQYKAFHF
jgi:hypothetical protein